VLQDLTFKFSRFKAAGIPFDASTAVAGATIKTLYRESFSLNDWTLPKAPLSQVADFMP
jgi:hypothetical protein